MAAWAYLGLVRQEVARWGMRLVLDLGYVTLVGGEEHCIGGTVAAEMMQHD